MIFGSGRISRVIDGASMNDISQKLAVSLEQLQQLQDSGVVAIQSKQLSRLHRERLLKHGFIREVIRG